MWFSDCLRNYIPHSQLFGGRFWGDWTLSEKLCEDKATFTRFHFCSFSFYVDIFGFDLTSGSVMISIFTVFTILFFHIYKSTLIHLFPAPRQQPIYIFTASGSELYAPHTGNKNIINGRFQGRGNTLHFKKTNMRPRQKLFLVLLKINLLHQPFCFYISGRYIFQNYNYIVQFWQF